MGKRTKKFIVIGGGLAGLAATMKLCESKAEVLLVSYQEVKRSHSVCAQGGSESTVDHKEASESTHDPSYDSHASPPIRSGHQHDPCLAGACLPQHDEHLR